MRGAQIRRVGEPSHTVSPQPPAAWPSIHLSSHLGDAAGPQDRSPLSSTPGNLHFCSVLRRWGWCVMHRGPGKSEETVKVPAAAGEGKGKPPSPVRRPRF
jgi:hypothetical protein